MPEPDNARLLAGAASGDASCWKTIVNRYAGLVWSVARAHRLSEADAADVTQATWLRLVERMDDLRDPERLGAWLATIARREAINVLRRASRDVPGADVEQLLEGQDTVDPPDGRLLIAERDAALHEAFEALPAGCRRLLRALLADPPPSYADVAAALAVPIGSIGPTRGRCLAALRRSLT